MKNDAMVPSGGGRKVGVFAVVLLLVSLVSLPIALATSKSSKSCIDRSGAASCVCLKLPLTELSLGKEYCWTTDALTFGNPIDLALNLRNAIDWITCADKSVHLTPSSNTVNLARNSLRAAIDWITDVSNLIHNTLAKAPLAGTRK